MKELIEWIKATYQLTAIPVRVLNEKRWESMDEIIVRERFEGVPQRVNFNDGFGVIIYDWDEVAPEVIVSIRTYYIDNVA